MYERSKRTVANAMRIAALATALFACHWAHAEYWISIGAYRAVAAADQVAATATDQAGIAFSSRAADTPDGSIYRVVAGPYPSRSEAQARIAQVHQAGFVDGWIVASGALRPAAPAVDGPLDASLGGDPSLGSDLDGVSVDDLSLDDWSLDDDLPPIEVLLEGLPDLPPAQTAPLRTQPSAEPAPPVVVPENYKLNRLRRDAAGVQDARASPPDDAKRSGLFRARMKWYTSGRSLPAGDALRQQSGESTPLAHNADLRLMWRPQFGDLKFHVHHSAAWLRTDVADRSPGLTFDQTATADDRRLMDLTWGDRASDADGTQRVHRLDRFAAEYRTARWGVTVGRQALSWGGGMAFQPMDLFNPFAPTTVDQDYKAGDDMILVEHLFGNGSDLQMLAVMRREPGRDGFRGDVTADAGSVAAKYALALDDGELELMAAHHYGEQVLGAGMRIPLGGALLRSDLVWARADGRIRLSGLVNADYTFAVAESPVHVFAEYFHNGFGVSELPTDLSALPTPLLERIAVRRELFNLMRNYLAVGTSFRWHFLLNQTATVLANLHDSSYLAQTALNYDSSNASTLQVGLAVPIGNAGDEFGTLAVGDERGLTVGGGEQGFLRFVRYF